MKKIVTNPWKETKKSWLIYIIQKCRHMTSLEEASPSLKMVEHWRLKPKKVNFMS